MEDAKYIILPDPMGALEYESHHLEAWGPSILYPLSFMSVSQSVSHLLQAAIGRASEQSPRQGGSYSTKYCWAGESHS